MRTRVPALWFVFMVSLCSLIPIVTRFIDNYDTGVDRAD
jgi:hypothetical protein